MYEDWVVSIAGALTPLSYITWLGDGQVAHARPTIGVHPQDDCMSPAGARGSWERWWPCCHNRQSPHLGQQSPVPVGFDPWSSLSSLFSCHTPSLLLRGAEVGFLSLLVTESRLLTRAVIILNPLVCPSAPDRVTGICRSSIWGPQWECARSWSGRPHAQEAWGTGLTSPGTNT